MVINGTYKGNFTIESAFRTGIFDALKSLLTQSKVHVLSGDSEKDKGTLNNGVQGLTSIQFNQSPQDKKNYIESLKNSGSKVLMISDGLNDSGALKQADIGIAISEDIFRFTPGSDAIINADSLSDLPKLMEISRFSRQILSICYGFSILYNVVGLTFAIAGELTPLIAAILMPLSSISIVFISTISAQLKSK